MLLDSVCSRRHYHASQLFILYYVPKTDYMVLHLDSKKQREAWLAIYRYMQLKYHTGLALGVIAAMLAAKATC